MAKAYTNFGSKSRMKPIPGKEEKMVMNDAGGYSFILDDWQTLDRFIILGSEGGTYYVGESKLTADNAGVVKRCLKADFIRTIDRITEISVSGRAASNDPALFALALAMCDPFSVNYAGEALQRVARIGTDILHFASFLHNMRGEGVAVRRAYSNWYNCMDDESLAFQMAKYQSRDGWSHADILRIAHVKPSSYGKQRLFQWATGKLSEDHYEKELFGMPLALHRLNKAKTETEVLRIIRETGAPLEVIPTEWRSRDVYEAVLPNLGVGAIVRNLGNMSAKGMSNSMLHYICELLKDPIAIKKSRIHPFKLAIAIKTYGSGRGIRGDNSWSVDRNLQIALEIGLDLSFGNVPETNKTVFHALDISGSMTWNLAGKTPFMASEAACMMALVSIRRDSDDSVAYGFSDNLIDLSRYLNKRTSFLRSAEFVKSMSFGGTDCALPVLMALNSGTHYDGFVVYTDGDTWAGRVHVDQALAQYRERVNPLAKFVMVAMHSRPNTLVDPDDRLSLNVVGLDAGTPALISDFIGGVNLLTEGS